MCRIGGVNVWLSFFLEEIGLTLHGFHWYDGFFFQGDTTVSWWIKMPFVNKERYIAGKINWQAFQNAPFISLSSSLYIWASYKSSFFRNYLPVLLTFMWKSICRQHELNSRKHLCHWCKLGCSASRRMITAAMTLPHPWTSHTPSSYQTDRSCISRLQQWSCGWGN